MEQQKYGGRIYTRWNGRNTEGGCTIDGTAVIRREDVQYMERQKYGGRMYNRWNGRNTEGGCTIDGTAELWREDVH